MSELTVVLIDPQGVRHEVRAPAGWSVMEAAMQRDVPGIVAECGGSCACATCHVHVAPEWADRLPPPDEMELDLLSCTAELADSSSRLSCQLRLTPALDGLVVTVAASQL